MAKEDNLKPFKKGFDPRRNLSGAPKKTIPEIDELLERWAGGKTPEEAEINIVAKKLVEKAKNGDIDAIKFLFERIYGKVVSQIDLKSGGNVMPAPVINILPKEEN